MMDVYQNTHCNIAAADASYSEQGCFFYRDLSLIPPITVETRWNNFAHNGSYHVHPNTEVSSDKKRALGSRRNVVAACSGRNLTRAEEDKLEVSSNKKYALRYWHKIVDAYSGCKLTRAKDKLVAISGLAKRVQSFSGDEYLAGLWKKALLYGLLWRAQWEDLIEEHASSQAPTWSWASIEGFIFYDDLMIPWDDEEHLSIKIVTILASGVISVALMSLDKSKSVSPA
ncbi:hypothetical protein HO173_004720 [Letharia columbiana]|uniref:Uncharacterized protein n=1 Tax=Letharia columbiana TaxID=112416 RepID=A0A8H6L6E8_9LECA|nr:uncharacterized protein HO173_004720 [Letharia columbiana]KAF6237252.1 hypothetical protein HO173_004720 [Letharia columbiana]